MNRKTRTFSHLMMLWGAMLLVGCYAENPVTDDVVTGDFYYPSILVVDPEDGASDVDRYGGYTIRFGSTMDTGSVSSNSYLTGGNAMRQWMDSLFHLRGKGGMNGMGDPDRDHMMHWMDSISYSGHFEWNDGRDRCVFYPDSALDSSTEYMFFITGDVRSHDGYRMQMDSLQFDGYMFHFTTGP